MLLALLRSPLPPANSRKRVLNLDLTSCNFKLKAEGEVLSYNGMDYSDHFLDQNSVTTAESFISEKA